MIRRILQITCSAILLLLASATVNAQHVLFSGMVGSEASGDPIASTIFIKNGLNGHPVTQCYSDSTLGAYFFVLTGGFYNMTIESDGYETLAVNLTVDDNSDPKVVRDFLLVKEGGEEEVVAEVEPETETESSENEEVGDKLSLFGDEDDSEDKVQMASIDSVVDEPEFDPAAKAQVELLTREGKQYVKSSVYYEPGEFILSPDNIAELNRLLPYFQVHNMTKVQIGGHSDMSDLDLGTPAISELRADEVYKFLIIQGISKYRLEKHDFGISSPDRSSLSKSNRRVEFILAAEEDESAAAMTESNRTESASTDPEESTTATKVEDDGLSFTQEEVEEIQSLYILFDKKSLFNKKKAYELKEEMEGKADSIFNFLSEHEKVSVEIQGHADEKEGKEKYKAAVSLQRAKALVDYLSKNGIRLKRITWKGFGDSKAIAPNSSKVGRAKNRRAQVELTGIKVTREKYKFVKPDASLTQENEDTAAKPVVDLDQMYYDVLEKYGLDIVPDLQFRVQVGAFMNPLPKTSIIHEAVGADIWEEKFDDGITRYMTGTFDNLSAADIYRKETQTKGIVDAFVVAYYLGKRISITKVEPVYLEHREKAKQ